MAAVLAVAIAIAVIAVATEGGGGSKPSGAHSGSSSSAGSTTATGRHDAKRGDTRGSRSGASKQPTGKQPQDVAVPILMYHVINAPPAGAPLPGLYVPRAEFEAQMQALAHAGYVAVTLDELSRHWREDAPLPQGKPIVLSFDNGYQSQYTNALPVLEALGWKGVENIQLTGLAPSEGGISEAQVRGLLAAGWELDTQGFSHAELTALPASALHYQVAVARQTLQWRYDVPVHWFCYPSGDYDATVIAAVKAAGYSGATTVIPGWASPAIEPFTLPRLRVLGGTTGAELLSLIEASEHSPTPPSSYSG